MARFLRLLGFDIGRGVRFAGVCVGEPLRVDDGAVVGPDVRLGCNVVVGAGSLLRARARLRHRVTLGERCVVGEAATLENITVGDRTVVESEVLCLGAGGGAIAVGNDSYLGVRTVLDWSDVLTIGSCVHVAGPSTALWTHSSVRQAAAGCAVGEKSLRTTGPVEIEDNSYVGCNCTIYPGVRVGKRAVVLPNSAVNRDVLDDTMVGGVPALPVGRPSA